MGGATRTYGVIGWPVRYSLSPAIHNAAFAALGIDGVYVPLPVPPGRLPQALDGLVALGLDGANVTIPHKTEAAALCDDLSEDARRLQAVNTLVVGERLVGHNTDAPGFDRFLRQQAAVDVSGRTALLYGAGGAGRAVALALARAGVATLTVAVREPERAGTLIAVLEGLPTVVRVVPFEEAAGERADLVVNATPLGADGQELPPARLGPGDVAVDLLYQTATTPFLARAHEAGARAFNGLGFLLHQAALSFELWTGRQPPLEVCSAAALVELAERG